MTTSFEAHLEGRWQVGGEWLEVRDPADWDCVVGRVPALDAAAIGRAYATARQGALVWGRTNALARGAVLLEVARTLRQRGEVLAELLSRENGKTLAEARGEVGKAAEFFEFFGSVARLPYGELLHDARPNTTTTTRHEPVGVVLVITPWNDPLLTPARKLAPALAAGNAVVFKPASDTPLIALELTRVLLDAGLPSEVITTVTGRARDIADALLHAELDAVTFTGSTDVGLDLQRALAGRNLRVQTEMGGKNASIVLDDADLGLAADTIAAASFAQAGQRCTATSRVIAQSGVVDPLVALLAERAAALHLGRGDADGTTLGPVVSRSHQNEVLDHVRSAVADGATVVTGGGVPSDDALRGGCFVEPTILRGITTESAIWRNEVFGPVIAVLEVADLDDAIRIANESVYGLSAALFTRSLASADRFLRDIQTGQAAVNLPTSGWDVHHPFGGYKLSGSPFKEQGLDALQFYTRVKTCAVKSW
jgi:acyl-CoA reductase-like NAD-dependent aldehyde dehydrogenase